MAENRAIEHASNVSLGITVALLYVVFVTSVFAGFATYIYRTDWTANLSTGTDGESGTIADIDNLIFVINRERVLTQRHDQTLAWMAELQARKFEIEAEQASIDSVLGDAENNIKSQVERMLAGLDAGYFPEEEKSARALLEKPGTPIQKAREAVQYVVEHNPTANMPESTETAALDAIVLGLRQTDALIQEYEGKKQVNDQAFTLNDMEVQRAEHQLGVILGQLDALRERLPPGSAERARLAALSMDIPIIGEAFQKLVSFPTIFLTLIVTIAAGGLGTVVSFSRRYYAGENGAGLTLSRLFVNVGEGIAAALAIFLFSGAGMLAFTQGTGSSNEVELSPYTVAFIAFLSGFMAEDAFASIQSAGKRIFKRDDDDKGDGGGGDAATA